MKVPEFWSIVRGFREEIVFSFFHFDNAHADRGGTFFLFFLFASKWLEKHVVRF